MFKYPVGYGKDVSDYISEWGGHHSGNGTYYKDGDGTYYYYTSGAGELYHLANGFSFGYSRYREGSKRKIGNGFSQYPYSLIVRS